MYDIPMVVEEHGNLPEQNDAFQVDAAIQLVLIVVDDSDAQHCRNDVEPEVIPTVDNDIDIDFNEDVQDEVESKNEADQDIDLDDDIDNDMDYETEL